MEEDISDYTGQMIEDFLINLTQRVRSLQEFCNEAKRYEHTKFAQQDYEEYYFDLKRSYILHSFNLELESKLFQSLGI